MRGAHFRQSSPRKRGSRDDCKAVVVSLPPGPAGPGAAQELLKLSERALSLHHSGVAG